MIHNLINFFSMIIIFHCILINCSQNNENFDIKKFYDWFLKNNQQKFSNKTFNNINPLILEDAKLSGPEIIHKHGYPSEVHHVITEDGYIIEMHRISNPNKQPILLMHGLLDTSATWILMGPKNGLGYLLHNLGYDVWMGNVRGNRYSKNHTSLKIDDRKFWDFSFHEMGIYDIPAMIDYILNKTGYQKIHYIGHSQGTTIFWIMCSERPDYMEKIISMHALAPIAFVTDMKSPFIKGLLLAFDVLSIATNFLQINEFMPYSQFLVENNQKACHDAAFTQDLCSNILFLIAGFNSQQLNKTMLPVILSHTPSGASAKQFLHFGQMARSGYFRQFNYGFYHNLKKYQKLRPPKYQLNHIHIPIFLYYSQNDWLSIPENVEKLSEYLPNIHDKYLVPMLEFNHLDFLWAVDVKKLLYNRIIDNLKEIENNEKE